MKTDISENFKGSMETGIPDQIISAGHENIISGYRISDDL